MEIQLSIKSHFLFFFSYFANTVYISYIFSSFCIFGTRNAYFGHTPAYFLHISANFFHVSARSMPANTVQGCSCTILARPRTTGLCSLFIACKLMQICQGMATPGLGPIGPGQAAAAPSVPARLQPPLWRHSSSRPFPTLPCPTLESVTVWEFWNLACCSSSGRLGSSSVSFCSSVSSRGSVQPTTLSISQLHMCSFLLVLCCDCFKLFYHSSSLTTGTAFFLLTALESSVRFGNELKYNLSWHIAFMVNSPLPFWWGNSPERLCLP